MNDIKTIIGITAAVVLLVIFFIQIKRIVRLKTLLTGFLHELKTLNNNLSNIIRYIHGKTTPDHNPDAVKQVCHNCVHRLAYISPDLPEAFLYKCKLDDRIIGLNDTCKRFQNYFQGTTT